MRILAQMLDPFGISYLPPTPSVVCIYSHCSSRALPILLWEAQTPHSIGKESSSSLTKPPHVVALNLV